MKNYKKSVFISFKAWLVKFIKLSSTTTLVVPTSASSVLTSPPFLVSVVVFRVPTLIAWFTAGIVSWFLSWWLLSWILFWVLSGFVSLSPTFGLRFWTSVLLDILTWISVLSVSAFASFLSFIFWVRWGRWIWWTSRTGRIWAWAWTSLSFVFFLTGVFLLLVFLLFGSVLGFIIAIRFSLEFGIFLKRGCWRVDLFGLIFLLDEFFHGLFVLFLKISGNLGDHFC